MAVVAVGLLVAQSSLSAPTEEKADANARSSETFATIESVTLRFVGSPVDADPELFFGCGDGSNGYYAERPKSPEPLIEW